MTQSQQKPASNHLLCTAEVMSRLSISRTTLWRLERTTDFPKAITFGRQMKRWKDADVEAYIARQSG